MTHLSALRSSNKGGPAAAKQIVGNWAPSVAKTPVVAWGLVRVS